MTVRTFQYCDICNDIIEETPTKTPRCFSISVYRHHFRDPMCGTILLSKGRGQWLCCHACAAELTGACFAFDDNITRVIRDRVEKRRQELQSVTKLGPEVLMPAVPVLSVVVENDFDELKGRVSKFFDSIRGMVFW